ncbi:hypothetical protein BJ742DRAFT_2466 [Cladochytrium replicatum]|nr:hypothetical protein BJ742DRAFT_2466 [Cladochytrium replicatum]
MFTVVIYAAPGILIATRADTSPLREMTVDCSERLCKTRWSDKPIMNLSDHSNWIWSICFKSPATFHHQTEAMKDSTESRRMGSLRCTTGTNTVSLR